MKYYLFSDDVYGFTAISSSKTMAWQMIRNKCSENNLKVPTFDKIKKIKEVPDFRKQNT